MTSSKGLDSNMDDKKALHILARNLLLKLMNELLAAGEECLPGERELCERLGVSRITVKKVVRQLVSEDRIISVPRKGHFINKLPPAKNIGVIMCDRGDVSFLRSPAVLKGIINVAERNSCYIRVIQLRNPAGIDNLLKKHKLDGCIWYLPDPQLLHNMAAAMKKSSMPSIVILGNWDPRAAELPVCVVLDPAAAGRGKAQFLLARGHRKIARFNLDPKDLVEAEEVSAAILAAGAELKDHFQSFGEGNISEIQKIIGDESVSAAIVHGGESHMHSVLETIAKSQAAGRIELLLDYLGMGMDKLMADCKGLKIVGICHFMEQEKGEIAAQAIVDHLNSGRPLNSARLGIKIRQPGSSVPGKAFLENSILEIEHAG